MTTINLHMQRRTCRNNSSENYYSNNLTMKQYEAIVTDPAKMSFTEILLPIKLQLTVFLKVLIVN